MIDQQFPQYLDSAYFQEGEQALRGVIASRMLPRLSESVVDANFKVTVSLRCRALPEIGGSLAYTAHTSVKLMCQRCMQIFDYSLECCVTLAVARSEKVLVEYNSLYDGIVMPKQGIAIIEQIEDELLLALPMYPMHPPNQCQQLGLQSLEELLPQRAKSDRHHPFAQLKNLVEVD